MSRRSGGDGGEVIAAVFLLLVVFVGTLALGGFLLMILFGNLAAIFPAVPAISFVQSFWLAVPGGLLLGAVTNAGSAK